MLLQFELVSLIVLLNLLLYWRTLKFKLINDDYATFHICSKAPALNTFKRIRPYGNRTWPVDLKKERIFSIAIHTTVACYIYYAFGMTFYSFIAAILFSMHPAAVQVPAWLSGRHHGWDALMFLIAYAFSPWCAPLLFLSQRGYPTNFIATLVFAFTRHWYVSLLFPLLAMWHFKPLRDIIRRKIGRRERQHRLGYDHDESKLTEDFYIHKFHPGRLIIAVKTFGYYALSCLLPLKNGFFNSFLVTMGMSKEHNKYWFSLNRHFWGGLFAIVVMSTLWTFP